jgi:cytoskeletal protein CcmA (bactofilin family)
MDTFRLPETAANKTGNNTYDIITSKGGTISGNLTLTSTLDLSGATVTGPIRIKSNTDAALNKLGSIAIGPDNG